MEELNSPTESRETSFTKKSEPDLQSSTSPVEPVVASEFENKVELKTDTAKELIEPVKSTIQIETVVEEQKLVENPKQAVGPEEVVEVVEKSLPHSQDEEKAEVK